MDQLKLNGIEVECIIGDLPEERESEQRLLVGNIREALEDAQCRLLERAAGVVADVCLSDPRVERVTVGVRKFGSVSGLGSAEVKVTRS